MWGYCKQELILHCAQELTYSCRYLTASDSLLTYSNLLLTRLYSTAYIRSPDSEWSQHYRHALSHQMRRHLWTICDRLTQWCYWRLSLFKCPSSILISISVCFLDGSVNYYKIILILKKKTTQIIVIAVISFLLNAWSVYLQSFLLCPGAKLHQKLLIPKPLMTEGVRMLSYSSTRIHFWN